MGGGFAMSNGKSKYYDSMGDRNWRWMTRVKLKEVVELAKALAMSGGGDSCG